MYKQVLQLSFEDFLEALVRAACRKALPTAEHVREAGCADGGELLLRIRESPTQWSAFLDSHSVEWGAEPLQPTHLAVGHLLAWMIRTISGRRAGPVDLTLSKNEVDAFVKRRGARADASGSGAVGGGAAAPLLAAPLAAAAIATQASCAALVSEPTEEGAVVPVPDEA